VSQQGGPLGGESALKVEGRGGGRTLGTGLKLGLGTEQGKRNGGHRGSADEDICKKRKEPWERAKLKFTSEGDWGEVEKK